MRAAGFWGFGDGVLAILFSWAVVVVSIFKYWQRMLLDCSCCWEFVVVSEILSTWQRREGGGGAPAPASLLSVHTPGGGKLPWWCWCVDWVADVLLLLREVVVVSSTIAWGSSILLASSPQKFILICDDKHLEQKLFITVENVWAVTRASVQQPYSTTPGQVLALLRID